MSIEIVYLLLQFRPHLLLLQKKKLNHEYWNLIGEEENEPEVIEWLQKKKLNHEYWNQAKKVFGAYAGFQLQKKKLNHEYWNLVTILLVWAKAGDMRKSQSVLFVMLATTMTPLLLLNAKFPINYSSQNDLDIKVLKRIIYYFND